MKKGGRVDEITSQYKPNVVMLENVARMSTQRNFVTLRESKNCIMGENITK